MRGGTTVIETVGCQQMQTHVLGYETARLVRIRRQRGHGRRWQRMVAIVRPVRHFWHRGLGGYLECQMVPGYMCTIGPEWASRKEAMHPRRWWEFHAVFTAIQCHSALQVGGCDNQLN